MLSAQRRHDHRRVNKNREWMWNIYYFGTWSIGWHNRVGIGKYWKGQLHRARRRYWRDYVRGIRPKSTGRFESEVNWRAT